MLFNQNLIAIDFGSSAIKIAEVRGQGRKKLHAIGIEPLPPECIVDGLVVKPDEVSKTLQTLLKRTKIFATGRRAAISLNGRAVSIKKLEVDASINKADLSDQVFYEAQQHFNQDFENTSFTFYKMKPLDPGSATAPTLLVGAKNDIIDSYLEVIHTAGMKVGVIDCDVFCTFNIFEFGYGIQPEMVLLVNIGSSTTDVTLVMNGVYLYSRDMALGVDEYLHHVMNQRGQNMNDARAIFESASTGTAVAAEIQKVFNETNDQFVNELKTLVDYYFQSGDAPGNIGGISGVYLSGDGATILGLDTAVAATFQVPVKHLNPFQNIDVDKKLGQDFLLSRGPSFSVAMGLALRKINDTQE